MSSRSIFLLSINFWRNSLKLSFDNWWYKLTFFLQVLQKNTSELKQKLKEHLRNNTDLFKNGVFEIDKVCRLICQLNHWCCKYETFSLWLFWNQLNNIIGKTWTWRMERKILLWKVFCRESNRDWKHAENNCGFWFSSTSPLLENLNMAALIFSIC